jgi:hypothetical protein
LATARTEWLEFFSGTRKFIEMINDDCTNIVFACPESSKLTTRLVRVVQENLIIAHAQNKEFKLGLLINIHRFPLDANDQEDLVLGNCLYSNPFLDIHNWPFIDRVVVLAPQKLGQFGISNNRSVCRSSYYGVIEFSSDATQNDAKAWLKAAHTNKITSGDKHPYAMNWGAHRVDLPHLDQMWEWGPTTWGPDRKDPRLPTWKNLLVKPPKWTLMAESQSTIPLVIGNQMAYVRASIDFPAHLLDPVLEALKNIPKAPSTDIDFKPRRSYASFKDDKLEAFDITVSYSKANTQHSTAAQEVLQLAMWLHHNFNILVMSGFVDSMNLDRNETIAAGTVFMQFSHSEVLWDLFNLEVVEFVYFLSPHHAAVTLWTASKLKAGTPTGLKWLIRSKTTMPL